MKKELFSVTITDSRGKYSPKTYQVTGSERLFAAAEAVQKYIKDNKHPPYRAGKSFSRYFSRFRAEVKAGN